MDQTVAIVNTITITSTESIARKQLVDFGGDYYQQSQYYTVFHFHIEWGLLLKTYGIQTVLHLFPCLVFVLLLAILM